jgi:hypothetical protein
MGVIDRGEGTGDKGLASLGWAILPGGPKPELARRAELWQRLPARLPFQSKRCPAEAGQG